MKSDIPARTFEFAKRVVRLCQVLDENPGVGRTLSKQLIRSGTSIGANVEEGQGSQSRRDFISKYSIACKEAREFRRRKESGRPRLLAGEDYGRVMLRCCQEGVAIHTTV